MYTTLDKVKIYLWISGTSNDARLQCILDGVEAFVFNIIWDISENDKTESVCTNLLSSDGNTFPLSNKKVTQVKTINGNDFTTKANGTDYLIRANDTVTVPSLCTYLSDLIFDVFSVTYTSGYNPVPTDIQNAIAELVGFTFAKELGKNISSETTWPRKVSFGWAETTDTKVNEALTVINNYQVLNLKHFT